MKRIQLCAMFLGLLTCSALAADQQQLVDGSGNVISNAQFFLVVAGEKKLVELPQTNGTVNLSALSSQPNIANQPVEAWVYRCDQDPKWRVYYLSPGQTAPENKEHCEKWKLAVLWFGGSHWVIKEGPEAASPVHLQQGPSGSPVSTRGIPVGPSFFGAKAEIAFGFSQVPDLNSGCNGVPGCSTSNKGFALEGGVGASFGPVDVLFGGFHNNDVSTTATETFTLPGGGTATSTETEKWHVNGGEVTARFNVAGIKVWSGREIILGPQGGLLVWTIKGMDSFSSSSGGPTSSGSENFSFGGRTGWWGAHAQIPICGHFSGTLDYKRAVLQHTFAPGDRFSQSMNSFLFGVSFSVTKPKAAWEF